jgi:hypothetical protein
MSLYKIVGGEYLPLINASRVLSSVIQRAILEEDTLSQLFRHLNVELDIEYNSLYHYKYVEKRARFMIEYCKTMADIRRWLFTYCHRDSKPYSPPSYSDFIGSTPPPFINVDTSTPVTDDEGYRTRLPTTASADSSLIHINGSPPVLRHHLDLIWIDVFDDAFS